MRSWGAAAVALALLGAVGSSQTVASARLAILAAEERGARDGRDLGLIRAGVRATDPETARTAVRALGRLKRPALVPDIAPALTSRMPEVRSEAANAVAEALSLPAVPPASAIDSALRTLVGRLDVEAEANVRAALCESIGRMVYAEQASYVRAERALVALAHSDLLVDRLGVAKGLESLVRMNGGRWPLSPSTIEMLGQVLEGRDDQRARIRRLAVQTLLAAHAIDLAAMARAVADSDPQVRRLAVIAAAEEMSGAGEPLVNGALRDPATMVRIAALRGLNTRARGGQAACQAALGLAQDIELSVAVAGLDVLGDCAAVPGASAYLEQAAGESSDLRTAHGWQRQARALRALVRVDPDRARMLLDRFRDAALPQLRMTAVGAAASLRETAVLTKLGEDADPRVRSVALAAVKGTQPDDVTQQSRVAPSVSDADAADLRRLAAPLARVTVRDVGTFELALFTTEAPITVLRFARLAEAGFFDGALIAQDASTSVEVSASRNARPAPDGGLGVLQKEQGTWPHVRGGVGLVPGVNGQDARVFVSLVDNPRLDHDLTVFAQVLNGVEIVDRLVEGDIIDRIEIVP